MSEHAAGLQMNLQVTNYLTTLQAALHRIGEQLAAFSDAVQILSEARTICTLGVGKSSYVAMKLAASFRSLGLTADFVHAGEALHGDLGRIHERDAVVIFSKSGNSQEITRLLPFLQSRNTRLVAVTNMERSPLGQAAQVRLSPCTEAEGDRHNLLPLVSCTASMAIADILTCLMGERLGLSVESFRKNHPGGHLGFAAGVRLADLPSWKTRRPFIQPSTPILDSILLISQNKAGLAVVVDEANQLLGILTDGDIRRALSESTDLTTATSGQWMNSNPVVLSNQLFVGEALDSMEGSRKVFAAPVVGEHKICEGVVTLHDLFG